MSIFLAYIFYFISTTAAALQRRWLATNREGESIGQIDFAFKVMLVISVFGLMLPLIEPFQIKGNGVVLALLSLVSGVSGAAFLITLYSAQKHVDAGVSTLVSNIYTPITIILASLMLNEGLSGKQILGTVFLLFSIFLISKKHRIGRFRFDTYFLMVVASGVLLGILLTTERALQKISGFSAGTLMSWWSQCLVLGLATLIDRKISGHTVKDTVATGSLRALAAISWVVLVYTVDNLSIASAVSTFKIVVIFLAAAIFLKEREDLPRKIIGSFIAVLGLLLMK
jgi:drug/metabolite transporter (DMT)-like permease